MSPLVSYNEHYMIGQFVSSLFYIKHSNIFELITYGTKVLLYTNGSGFVIVGDFCDKVL